MGGSAAETPTQPDAPPAGVVRASDAERDEVVGKLKEEFVAGRLSQDTFMYRMHAVLQARHQTDLPPLLADLPGPARALSPLRSLTGRLRAAWPRRTRTGAPAAGDAALRPPAPLEFPRGAGDVFSIGRNGSCDLAIADLTVSRVHARLERTPDGWLLTDLSSTNGTRVNGWRVRGQVRVRPGDVVSFGDARYSLSAPDGA